jgi:hypothetical protein
MSRSEYVANVALSETSIPAARLAAPKRATVRRVAQRRSIWSRLIGR